VNTAALTHVSFQVYQLSLVIIIPSMLRAHLYLHVAPTRRTYQKVILFQNRWALDRKVRGLEL